MADKNDARLLRPTENNLPGPLDLVVTVAVIDLLIGLLNLDLDVPPIKNDEVPITRDTTAKIVAEAWI